MRIFNLVLSHITDAFEAHGVPLRFNFLLDFPPTVTLPEDVLERDPLFNFKDKFASVLEVFLRYTHRHFAGDHHLHSCVPGVVTQRMSEVGHHVHQLSDLYFGLTIGGARPSFC